MEFACFQFSFSRRVSFSDCKGFTFLIYYYYYFKIAVSFRVKGAVLIIISLSFLSFWGGGGGES